MLDVLIIGLFIYQVLSGWSKGLVRMLFQFIIMVASFMLSFVVMKLIPMYAVAETGNVLLFFIAFFVLRKILTSILIRLGKGINKIPVIGILNRFLGSVVGFGIATIIVFICAHFLKLLAPFVVDIQLLVSQSQLFSLFTNTLI